MFNQYYPGLQYNPTTQTIENEQQPAAAVKYPPVAIILIGIGILLLIVFMPYLKGRAATRRASGGSGMTRVDNQTFVCPGIYSTPAEETLFSENDFLDDLAKVPFTKHYKGTHIKELI